MSSAVRHSPFDLYGSLLAAVQTQKVFSDGKTFVDAKPKRTVAAIMGDFARIADSDGASLLSFVQANFELPIVATHPWPEAPAESLQDHIRGTWRHLARQPNKALGGCSELPIAHHHVVPGGRFRELYYWDSFFTMLGLVRDDEIALATGIVDAMTDLIEQYGHVPNGTRTYYIGRSQPPLYHMMVGLLHGRQPESSARRLAAMKAEHAWWMNGEDGLEPGQCDRRVAKLADGSVLNRYWDPRSTPRDESWREDVETAAEGDRPHDEIFRDLRAGAESGWDFSSRWLDDEHLSSIRTTTIAPVDLNAFLYSREMTIGASCDRDSLAYLRRADRRLVAMHRHCWSDEQGCFLDYDLKTRTHRRAANAASLAPLLCGLATAPQAAATARFVKARLLAPGGLRTTLAKTGQQWDAPNGWAPLQWIAVQGLHRYGHAELAQEIARRWIATVSQTYRATGLTHEKYDIETCSVGAGGEYEPQIGFGWTNGVTSDLMHRFAENLVEVAACPAPVGGSRRGAARA